MDEQQMVALAHSVLPDAMVYATNLAGGDHWHMVVVDVRFHNKRPLERQRMVLAAFKDAMSNGTVHALDLKCITPNELRERYGGNIPGPFLPHREGEGMHPGAWG